MRRAIRAPTPLLSLLVAGTLLAACSDTSPLGPPPGARPLASVDPVDVPGLGNPLPGLTSSQLASFNRGKLIFQRTFTPSTGLGPAFNASSCAECHRTET